MDSRKRRRPKTDRSGVWSKHWDSDLAIIPFECCSGTRVTDNGDLDCCIENADCPQCLKVRLEGIRLQSRTHRRRLKRRKTAFDEQPRLQTRDLRELALMGELKPTACPELTHFTYRGRDFFPWYLAEWPKVTNDFHEVYLGYDATKDMFYAGCDLKYDKRQHIPHRSLLLRLRVTLSKGFEVMTKWSQDLDFYQSGGRPWCFYQNILDKNNVVDVRVM